jgi:hypothetical protein
MADDQNYLAALKRERAVYEQTGRTERAEQVDAELERVQAAIDAATDKPAEEAPPVDPQPAAEKRATTRKRK